ncbi:unnamed protein product [Coregonus sp. 'balchen']|nr:unnamed protein product [Coregonus sp. 'balchen']
MFLLYVNCARREEEQNLVAFQYRGEILYRCCKPIAVGEELLVWYGEEYARDLGIVFDYLWDKKSSAKEGSAPVLTPHPHCRERDPRSEREETSWNCSLYDRITFTQTDSKSRAWSVNRL